jgi:hypothetical protein
MAEAEAKAQNEVERQRAISSAGDAGYDRWNDRQGRNLDLFQTLAGIESRERIAGMGGDEFKPRGMGAIAEQLGNSMPQDQASAGVAALGKVLSGGNYLHNAAMDSDNKEQPYDRTAVLIQKLMNEGLDPNTATQVGILYSQLG